MNKPKNLKQSIRYNMMRLAKIELFKENMKFSAAHFTIFSKEVRENVHGHNYNLHACFTTQVAEEGLSFDYRYYKKKLVTICKKLDETTLIPEKSPYLKISEQGPYYHVDFNSEVMIFLKRDATIIPVRNITVEELSHWFLEQIMQDKQELTNNKIVEISVKIFSGPGQAGISSWKA
jgi:6-pyruvoyltetrahydropterin/6-carboxytetrahydropterin synthase